MSCIPLLRQAALGVNMRRDPEDVALCVQLELVEIALQSTSKLGLDVSESELYSIGKQLGLAVFQQDLLHLVKAILERENQRKLQRSTEIRACC